MRYCVHWRVELCRNDQHHSDLVQRDSEDEKNCYELVFNKAFVDNKKYLRLVYYTRTRSKKA